MNSYGCNCVMITLVVINALTLRGHLTTVKRALHVVKSSCFSTVNSIVEFLITFEISTQ